MAKKIEIELNAINKELAKLEAQLTRREKALEKKTAKAEKLGVALSFEEFVKIRDNVTGEQYAAYASYSMAQDDLEETKRNIEFASKKAEKKTEAYNSYVEQKTEEDRIKALAEAKEEWAKEGIKVDNMYSNWISGTTPSGNKFTIDRNSGATLRSRHCYTVRISGMGVIFTSGEFWRAFLEVKNN